jgi:hypothetical protein
MEIQQQKKENPGNLVAVGVGLHVEMNVSVVSAVR